MGNCLDCCGQKAPCDHTEDETKGLLPSSESKTGTEACTSPDEECRHEELKTPQLKDEHTVTEQPVAEAQVTKAQSSYSQTISLLHTEASLATEVNHNVSPETDTPISAVEMPKTITEELQNIATEVSEAPHETVEAPAETVASVKVEIEGEHGPAEEGNITAGPPGDAAAAPTSSDSTLAPAEETPVKQAPVEAVIVLTQVKADKNLPEPEPKTHVVNEKEVEQALNNTTTEAGLSNTGDVSLMENSSIEPELCLLGQTNESVVLEKSVPELTAEEPMTEPTVEVEEKLSEDVQSEKEEQKQETSEAFQTQELSQEVESPGVDVSYGVSSGIENGLVKDSESLKCEIERSVDVVVVEKLPQKDDAVQKPNDEALETKNQLSAQTESTIELDKPEVSDSMTDQEKSEKVLEEKCEATEPTQNGLDSTCASLPSSPIEQSRPTETMSDFVAVEDTEAKAEVTESSVAELLEEVVKDVAETGPQQTEEEKGKQEEDSSVAQEKEEKEGISDTPKSETIFSSTSVEVQIIRKPEENVEEVQVTLDESADLYLGAEEIEMGASNNKPSKPLLELTIPGVETRCSLAPAVDILAYSEREWKGSTDKSARIRKGYSEMSHSFSGLRRVRGDNYCALRATLYQVLATSTNMPTWMQDEGFLLLPESIETREHLIGGWVFPPECKLGSEENSVEKLKYYLDLLKTQWRAAVACESPEKKQNLCECVFQGGDEEYGLLEALKFLMLAKAIELHRKMVTDQEVPVFCWLLFARDTSENPQSLLVNHLSQIGFSGGVEQVEMFLLGYALNYTIQAFRLYMTDTEEFVTHYPDDHKHEWPCVCIVTEDDRHYNVPVRRTVQHQHRDDFTMT
ncbi:fibrous sheath CABYR-binding protein isoform X2 [Danio aesculapii]|uniref:fibrous sheath CABYR-binding protein isoform X2 n=1 Tax=Danio aesculapii TaxID=1142201 RepID=UPI0024BF5F54|nr:fibrous sheath CABYR-binding protein isoform X2 [Danio aesculapii]